MCQQHAQIDWEGRKQDSLALVALYEATGGDNWIDNSGWLQTSLEEWHGVIIGENKRVIRLYLGSNNLIGNLPIEIGTLIDLTQLELYDNQLTGEIPSEIGNLRNLSLLHLGFNYISGEIPPEIGKLTNLSTLALTRNQLHGEIPPEIGNLIFLNNLYLSHNQLTYFPLELGNLKYLYYLNLSYNNIINEIAPTLVLLNNLAYLFLSNNQLKGTIPPEIKNLNSLVKFELQNNQLSNNIPPELGNLYNLELLNISFNQIKGKLPPEIGNLSKLYILDLSNNQLSGKIPIEIKNLWNLKKLYLNNNLLVDSIPKEINSLKKLEDFKLHNNMFISLPKIEMNLEILDIHNNFFVFKDIVPNLPLLKKKDYYYPQLVRNPDTIISMHCISNTIDICICLHLDSLYPAENNYFQWITPYGVNEKTSNPHFVFPNLDINNIGLYRCKISNPLVPDFEFLSDYLNLVVSELPKPKIQCSNLKNNCIGDTIYCSTNNSVFQHYWYNIDKQMKNFQNNYCYVTSNSVLTVNLIDTIGCESPLSEPAVIEFNKQPSPQQLFGAEQFCQNDSVLIYTSPDFIQYEWFCQQQKIDDSLKSELTIKKPGIFQVRVTDKNNCKSELSAPKQITEIQVPEPPTIELEEDNMCKDGFATIKGSTENVIWSDGHKSQERKIYSNGIFSARTLNNGCFSDYSDTLIIDQLVLPKPDITSSKTPTICEADSILLSTQSNHNVYNWILYENNNVVGSLTNNSSDLVVKQSFAYRVTYENKDGCKSELSDEIQIELFECWKDTTGFQLNSLTNGTRAEDYQLFSFPYKKEDQNPVSIFGDELGNYKKSAWRLFHFYMDKNEEYTKDFNTIERGKGYWLIYKDDISVHTGKVQYFDTENLPGKLENYTISLYPGWNQIGNPYDIDIPWNSIRESNPGFHEDLIVFHHFFQTGDTLKAFSGGFVYVDNAFELFVPYKFMQPDKKSALSLKIKPFSGWEVQIKLKNADIKNFFGGFGMHNDAYEGKDMFDKVCLPDFPYSFQTKFPKSKPNVPELSKDIVPMQDTYIWEFFIISDIEDETKVEFQISDISNIISNQNNKLILYDLSNQQQYDLRSFQKLHLKKGIHPFKAVYGDNAFVLENEPYQTVQLHNAYPNPVYRNIEFSFTIPENSEKQNVKLVLTDTNGKIIEVLRQGTYPSGTENIHWKKGNDISPGVYIYSLFIDNKKIDTKKMIIY